MCIRDSNKGVALYNLNKSDEAIKAYNKAIEIDPKYSMAWNNNCLLYTSTLNQFALTTVMILILTMGIGAAAISYDPNNVCYWDWKWYETCLLYTSRCV